MPASIRSASSEVKRSTSTRVIVVRFFSPPICICQIEDCFFLPGVAPVARGDGEAWVATVLTAAAEEDPFFAYPILPYTQFALLDDTDANLALSVSISV